MELSSAAHCCAHGSTGLRARGADQHSPCHMNASLLAYAALILFVPLSGLMFMMLRPPAAVAAILIAATLFLPEQVEFDAPLIPPMGKVTISGLCALVGILVTSRSRIFGTLPESYVVGLSGSLLVA